MRIFKSISLLLALTFPFWGSYFYFCFEKNQIKNEVARFIESGAINSDLINLTFSQSDASTLLKWEHPREFRFEGQMYDVVNMTFTGDSVTYLCYRDHKETRLGIERRKLIARALGHDPFHKQQNERIKNFFSISYLQHILKWKSPILSPAIIHFALNIKSYALIFIVPPTPPPE